MPEDNNNAAGLGLDPGAGENNSGVGTDQKPTASETGQTDAGDDDKKGGEGGDKGQQKTEGAKAPQGDDNTDDGEAPPVRKQLTPKDYIIQRKQKKIEKLEGVKGGDEGVEDDGILPEDEAIIDKVVSKRIAPLVKQTVDIADEREIKDFLSDNPEFKPFEAKARRWIKDPSRQHLPVSTVFYEVAGKKLFKIGAERQKKADEEAANTQTGGGSTRMPEGGKSVLQETPEEFEAHQEKVRRGQ